MGSFAKNKGANGEREAAKWLAKWLQLKEVPDRNLEQVRSGGHDLLVPPFVIEVKRCETISKAAWWKQVVAATKEGQCSVVMYRRNRQPWRFLVPATLIGVDSGFIELEAEIFLRFATKWVKE
jgi:hypothetical protein